MNKSLVGWEVIGDDVLPSYVGIFFCCYKDPVIIKQPDFFFESKAALFFLAHV